VIHHHHHHHHHLLQVNQVNQMILLQMRSLHQVNLQMIMSPVDPLHPLHLNQAISQKIQLKASRFQYIIIHLDLITQDVQALQEARNLQMNPKVRILQNLRVIPIRTAQAQAQAQAQALAPAPAPVLQTRNILNLFELFILIVRFMILDLPLDLNFYSKFIIFN